MRTAILVFGILLILAGGIWILQGIKSPGWQFYVRAKSVDTDWFGGSGSGGNSGGGITKEAVFVDKFTRYSD